MREDKIKNKIRFFTKFHYLPLRIVCTHVPLNHITVSACLTALGTVKLLSGPSRVPLISFHKLSRINRKDYLSSEGDTCYFCSFPWMRDCLTQDSLLIEVWGKFHFLSSFIRTYHATWCGLSRPDILRK